jgi:hypothetical protein
MQEEISKKYKEFSRAFQRGGVGGKCCENRGFHI